MAGSSGDERSPQLLTRGSSFQKQTRNTQKFNLKPKLLLKSNSDRDLKDEQGVISPPKHLSPKSPKTLTPKSPSLKMTSPRPSKFDFSVKPPGNGILKNTETFVTTKDINEFKSKIQHRTSFENENFRFGSNKKLKGENNNVEKPAIEVRPASPTDEIPAITISCSSRRGSSENLKKEDDIKEEIESDPDSIARNEADFNQIINQIREDLKQMNIVRDEGKPESGDEKTDSKPQSRSDSKKGGSLLSPEVHRAKSEKNKGGDIKKGTDGSRRGSQISEAGSRRNSNCRRDSNTLGVEGGPSRRESDCSALSEITECEDSPVKSSKMRDRRKQKSLTWKKKILDEKDDSNTQESLLPQDNSVSVLMLWHIFEPLGSSINHIRIILVIFDPLPPFPAKVRISEPPPLKFF